MSGEPFELKAEYEWRTVLLWHVVPAGASTALCGRFLAPAAQTRPIGDVRVLHHDEVCLRCLVRRGVRDDQSGAPTGRSGG
ncbi:hypothetical protein [Streptacidiphilus neutrinimicus]|uniref:hypothetical protein n=1 Tax=Streptacidiphilus neutrinimicus TaxID=105420 RepID=UPI0005A67CE8|nr:hypothetical protein [Streptacidiphilus neutrinimicus]